MKAAIDVYATAEGLWQYIVEHTADADERIYVSGYIAGRSWAECEYEEKLRQHDTKI